MRGSSLLVVGIAVALPARDCGGGEDGDPAEREDDTSSGVSVTSGAEPVQDARSEDSAAPADEP